VKKDLGDRGILIKKGINPLQNSSKKLPTGGETKNIGFPLLWVRGGKKTRKKKHQWVNASSGLQKGTSAPPATSISSKYRGETVQKRRKGKRSYGEEGAGNRAQDLLTGSKIRG